MYICLAVTSARNIDSAGKHYNCCCQFIILSWWMKSISTTGRGKKTTNTNKHTHAHDAKRAKKKTLSIPSVRNLAKSSMVPCTLKRCDFWDNQRERERVKRTRAACFQKRKKSKRMNKGNKNLSKKKNEKTTTTKQ